MENQPDKTVKDYSVAYQVYGPDSARIASHKFSLTKGEAEALHEMLLAVDSQRFYPLAKVFVDVVTASFALTQRTLSYAEFHEVAQHGEFPKPLASRAFMQLVRHERRKPGSLVVLCPKCGERFPDGCGHVTTIGEDVERYPVIDIGSLIVLTTKSEYQHILNFAVGCREVVDYVIHHLKD